MRTAKALRFLPSEADVKKSFIGYFDSGMGISESCNYHTKILELQDWCTEETLASGRQNPSERTVRYWHDQWREANFGPRCGIGMIEVSYILKVII